MATTFKQNNKHIISLITTGLHLITGTMIKYMRHMLTQVNQI